MEKTIFQRIIDREIPAEIVYEDEKYIAFMDIMPKSPGHTLVITKEPYRWVNDVPAFGEYWEVAKKVSQAVHRATDATYMSYQTYGVEVPHAHIHIVPRYGMSEESLSRRIASTQELAEFAEKIRAELAK
jgi:histidine triad (HIT) family protein